MRFRPAILLLLLLWVSTGALHAQFSISAASTNYTQDFNTLASSGTGLAWSNNTTLTGWYARTDSTATISTYNTNTGGTTTASLCSFGTASNSDRALGYAPTNAFFGASGLRRGFIGWRLKNNTGASIASITVTWTGEQWRKDNAAAQSLTVEYLTGTTVTTLTGGTDIWTSVPALTFTSPITATGGALDGNLAANRVANITTTITLPTPLANGDEIMLRWSDLNDAGNDHHLAIDDVTVSVTLAGAMAPTATTDAPTGIGTSGATLNGTVNDNGNSTTVQFQYGTTLSYGSTIAGTPSPVTGGSTAVSASLGSLSVNTQYHYRVSATNTGGTTNGSDQAFWTLANTPGQPTVSNPTLTTLDVALAPNGNPSGTEFAIHETSTNQFVQAGGTLGASAVWQTAATWGTKTVSGLSNATTYTFEVKARNGASVETGYGTSAPGTTNSSTTPVITVASYMSTFTTAANIASTEQQYLVEGINLTSDLVITAPTHFQVSLTSGSGFTSSLSLTPVSGTVATTTIYVRYLPSAPGSHSSVITHTSTGALQQDVSVAGNSVPSITTVGTFTKVARILVGQSSFTSEALVEGLRLAGNLTVTAHSGFEVSATDSVSGFASSVNLVPVNGTVATTSIWIRFTPTAVGVTTGYVVFSSPSAEPDSIVVNGHAMSASPTNPSTITVGTVDLNSVQLSFSGGNGSQRLVVARLGAPVNGTPNDSTVYTANAAFGSGWNVGTTGNYAVYNGSGSSVTVTGLAGSSTYHFAVYEFNNDGVPGAENYLEVSPGTASATTPSDPGLLLTEENFPYTSGTNLTANGFTAHGAGTPTLKVASSGLSYPGYSSSGIGNAAAVGSSGEDVSKTFTSQSPGKTVYVACMVSVTTAQTGDYFLHLGPASIGSIFRGRVFAKSAGAGLVQFGIATSSGSAVYAAGTYATSTTHLLVMRYYFTNSPSATHTADLFVNPPLTGDLPATPDATATETINVPTDIGTVALRQGSSSSAPTIVVDGIRVGTGWGPVSGYPTYAVSTTLNPGTYATVRTNGASVSLAGAATVRDTLDLANGSLVLGTHDLTLGPGCVLPSTPTASSMIVTNGTGSLKREVTGTGSVLFPVGDQTGTSEYSPATITLGSGTFGTPSVIAVNVKNQKGANNPALTDYLTRTWNVTQTGITAPVYDASFVYTDADVQGSEAALVSAKYDASTGWTRGAAAQTGTNTLSFSGLTSFSDFTGTSEQAAEAKLVVHAKVALQGPWSGTAMAGALNNTDSTLVILPLSQPYSDPLLWNYSGTENVSGTGYLATRPDILDWILLEVRSGNPATPPMTVVERRAAFVKTDGTIVDLDGVSPVAFKTATPGALYVVVYHRNHVPVMSASAASLSLSSTLYDFTTAASQAFGTDAQVMVGAGTYGLFAGDANGDTFIDINDFTEADNNQFAAGNLLYDTNLDGFVDINDFTSADNNQFVGSQIP